MDSETDFEDADAMAAQLLSQFQSSPAHNTASNETQDQDQDSEENEAHQPQQPRAMNPFIGIDVPNVGHESDYEYLPGHFAVRRILKLDSKNPQKPSYTVRLQSGEQQTMTYDRFMQLENSSQALDQFNPDSDSSDDLAVIQMNGRQRRLRAMFSGDGAASEESDPDFPRPSRRRDRRRAEYTQYFHIETESEQDELSDAPESSDDELNAPRASTRLRQRAKKAKTKSSSKKYADPDEGTRRSNRERKPIRKNMEERLEDDLSEAEAEGPRRPKYTGAREIFIELDRDDEFRNRHFGCCSTCNWFEDDEEKGILVFCQGCSSSYHQSCLGPRSSREHLVTKIDEGSFILQCRRCLGSSHDKHDVRPHLGHCAVCRREGPMSQPLRGRLTSKEEQQLRIANKGTDPVTEIDMALVNNVNNVLFRCTTCHRGFHAEHLPQTGGKSRTDKKDPFSEYKHWQCHYCSSTPGEIEVLVAWRPLQSKVAEGKSNLLPELIPEIDKEYLIKWKSKSYFRATWMPGDWVWGVSSPAMLRAFYNTPRKPIFTMKEAIPEENLRVDIVFNVSWVSEDDTTNPEMVEEAYVKYKGLNYEEAVWEVPPKPEETERWEDFKTAFEDWLRRDTIQPVDPKELKHHLAAIRQLDFETDLVLQAQPEMITNGELMEYQLEGVNWLYYMHFQQRNAILADDMGLGKTVQVIGLFATLIQKHSCWPFLVVAPNSTVPNWRREIKSWAPDIQVVTYFGSAYARQMAREHEMFPEGGKHLCCHVVIASYESMIDDEAKKVLSKVHWAGLVVDEGQRLKNDKSQLYERLARMKFDFKVLLTGTPLQNNIRELFNLIQFLDPKTKADKLEEEYGALTSDNIRALHKMISPFFLRRTKAEVLPFLPPMVQIIVPVSMSFVQKKLYKSILGKNPELIKAICTTHVSQLKKQEKYNLNNILMQLRKCLCHPFVYSREIEEVTDNARQAHERLVEASGKFQLLNLMLPKLQKRGHRVLIFSQFLENLDLVEDFLSGLELRYCRLDGRLVAREKQKQIDQFNAPDSPYFAFLLSTRSGGVGINLATADTVIIMDPDFNPKQDMQALSRAHRIGQKNVVLVYHLTTRASVEEKIMEKGKKKLALDHVLIERMEDKEDEEDLESILRHGAQALFEDDHSADVLYDEDGIDKLLDRSQAEKAEEAKKKDKDAKGAKDGDAQTNNPQFNFARVWQKDGGTLEEVTMSKDTPMDEDVWAKILKEREHHAREEAFRKAEGFGRGKRKRTQVNYQTAQEEVNDLDGANSTTVSPVKKRKSKASSESDDEFEQKGDVEESDSANDTAGDLDDMDIDIEPLRPKKSHPFKRVQIPVAAPALVGLDGTSDPDTIAPCIACEKSHGLGQCPLKEAGVEHCPLCGLAHLGGRRACPHFHSIIQIRRMLEALAQSKEAPSLVSAAKKYLRGVLGHLLSIERKQSSLHSDSADRIPSSQIPASRVPATERHPQPTPNPQFGPPRYTTNTAGSEKSMARPSSGTFAHQPHKKPFHKAEVSIPATHTASFGTGPTWPVFGTFTHQPLTQPQSRFTAQQPSLPGTSRSMPSSQGTSAQQPQTSNNVPVVDLTGPEGLESYSSPYPYVPPHLNNPGHHSAH
ncbi:hypothetical protein N7504_009126 [Penicillium tannophilum]|nr:hypothetical protein N7504_009126 [Penicillium tannophilum]